MKRYLILTSVLALTACGGGSGTNGADGAPGAQGAPGKSAYDIWLDAGNSGTEQDFLNSLVAVVDTSQDNTNGNNTQTDSGNNNESNQSANAQTNAYPVNAQQGLGNPNEWSKFYGGDYTVINMDWPAHNGYKQYRGTTTDTYVDFGGNSENGVRTYVYNEKELDLANYGVYLESYSYEREFGEHRVDTSVRTYIHNREGVGANVYVPAENSVFRGGTLAYLYKLNSSYSVEGEPVLLKGDAEYTHSATDPQLRLAFDNYYTLTMDKDGKVSMSGINNTGRSEFDLTPSGLTDVNGNQYVNYGYRYDEEYRNNTNIEYINTGMTGNNGTGMGNIGFVSKGNKEEAVGTYGINFERPEYHMDGSSTYYNDDIHMTGAFGGTKQ